MTNITKDAVLTLRDILQFFESRVPVATAESWDNVGLLAGDPAQKVGGAVIAIDLTDEVVEKAAAKNASLVITHHPCIFPRQGSGQGPQGGGLSRVVAGTPLFSALQKNIAVISLHTNFDQCALEVVETVSRGLGVTPQGRLMDFSSGGGSRRDAGVLLKLVVFVPATHLDPVRNAICEAGAGHIGHYDHCAFGTAGEGTFRGSDQAQPFLGKPGQLEKAQEIRLETIFPRGLKDVVLSALFKSHPYEEVAYDLYPVEQYPGANGIIRGLGYGFWGEYFKPKPFSDFIKDVKSLFGIEGFLMTHPAPLTVSRIGFVAGKGSSFLEAAQKVKCDVFLTGEAGYHTALRGLRSGITVLELGHRESEKFFLNTIEKWCVELGLRSEVFNSSVQRVCT